MFKKILVANRGEVARRIFRACRELGVRSVAIYSEVDQNAGWMRDADEAYPLSGVTAAESYLNQARLFEIVKEAGVDAIHPGYGFLSENADFAAACQEAGVKFIGPTPEAMRLLGSKASARELAIKAGVPVVPGVDGAGKSAVELSEAAAAIGYPVLIKASAGGGGKGMRVVWQAEDLADELRAARGESLSSFGSDHILLEKYFMQLHHIEVQVLGDEHGHLIHLFERECSIQRRHQKIIEETPSPNLTAELREQITQAAVKLAREAGYISAGTVEFLLSPEGAFYLLEMNTRLQVEHPITELVTGIDIAVWQIRIAAGDRLPFKQEEISQRGHAIESRVYAEDPANHFMPSTGRIEYYRAPTGPGVRVDDGIESGSEISPYYDPMLAKVISWGADRAESTQKMIRALEDTVILGVVTNIPYLIEILEHEAYIAGETATDFLNSYFPDWQPKVDESGSSWLGMIAWELLQGSGGQAVAAGENGEREVSPWDDGTNWRNVA